MIFGVFIPLSSCPFFFLKDMGAHTPERFLGSFSLTFTNPLIPPLLHRSDLLSYNTDADPGFFLSVRDFLARIFLRLSTPCLSPPSVPPLFCGYLKPLAIFAVPVNKTRSHPLFRGTDPVRLFPISSLLFFYARSSLPRVSDRLPGRFP